MFDDFTGLATDARRGTSISISADGNTAVVGGDVTGGAPTIWVFARAGGTWVQQGNPLPAGVEASLAHEARTYDQPASGTVGGGYASYGAASGLAAGTSAWLPQLAENADYRTNISLTNTGSVAATVTVTAGAGVVASASVIDNVTGDPTTVAMVP